MSNGNKSIVRELMIQVKNKNLKATVDSVHKLEGYLADSAVAAELLNNALDPIPANLREIIKEAEDIDGAFSAMGNGKAMDGLEAQLDQLNASMDDLIGTIVELQDTFTTGLNRSAARAERSMNDLLVASERTEDGIDGVTSAIRKQDAENKKSQPGWKQRLKDQENHNRNNSDTARGFAAISKAGGSLTVAYAVIAANVYALNAAFTQLTQGAQLNRLEQVGSVMGSSIGVPIQFIAKQMEEATGYTIAYEEALRQASSAATFGFSAKEITGMTTAARRASVALGVDMNDALNRIIRGVSKLEIELLDELGITVRLTEAYDTYSKSIGKNADELTSYQKQRAYLNAVLKESEERQGKIDPYLEANSWEKLGANIASATSRGKQWLAEVLEPSAGFIAKIFEQSGIAKGTGQVKAFADTMSNVSKTTSRADIFASLAGQAEEGDLALASLEEKAKKAQTAIYELEDEVIAKSLSGSFIGQSGVGGAEMGKLISELKEAEAAIDSYKAASKEIAKSIGVEDMSEDAILARNEFYKSAAALKHFRETYDSITASIKGSNEPFELLDKYLSDTNDLTAEAARLLEPMKEAYKSMGITGQDYLDKVATSSRNLRAEFQLQATMQEKLLAISEQGYKSGALASEVSLKQLREERKLLEAQLKTKQDGLAADSAKLAIQSQINANKLQELAIQRSIRDEQNDFINANAEFTAQFLRFSGKYSAHLTDREYEAMLLEDKLSAAERELDSMKEIEGLTAERLRKEAEILKIKQDQADLEAKNARADLNQNQSEAMNIATNAGGIGPLAMQELQLAETRKLANEQLEKGIITKTEYDAIMRQSNVDELNLEQAKLANIASINDLFLARTDQQSTLAMNAEEQLAYHTEIGAAMYENARSALDANNSVMGEMFDGLQNFAVALNQVGSTSESVWNGVSAGVQAASGVMSFMADKAVSDIDKQIAAEKARDGESTASLKKIAALEAKQAKIKESAQKKQIIANTAVGIMQALSTSTDIYSGMALAAIVAGMGAMQLSAVESSTMAAVDGTDITSLELGERSNAVDLSRGATSGELNYIRGSSGVGGIQDFVPRARGSTMSPNVRYISGEHGTEVVQSTSSGSSVSSNEEETSSKKNSTGIKLSLSINALDSKSIVDRSEDIFLALEEAAQARGFSLGS